MSVTLMPRERQTSAAVGISFTSVSIDHVASAEGWQLNRQKIKLEEPPISNIKANAIVMNAIKAVSQPTYEGDDWLDHAKNRVKALLGLHDDWDGHGGLIPSAGLRKEVLSFLVELDRFNLRPTKILASPQGGIGIRIKKANLFFSTEFRNSGEVFYILETSTVDELNLIDRSELPKLLGRVRGIYGN